MNIRTIIKRRRKALQASTPKQRDRLRHSLKVAQVAALLRKESKAA
jgi:hypothetical protein